MRTARVALAASLVMLPQACEEDDPWAGRPTAEPTAITLDSARWQSIECIYDGPSECWRDGQGRSPAQLQTVLGAALTDAGYGLITWDCEDRIRAVQTCAGYGYAADTRALVVVERMTDERLIEYSRQTGRDLVGRDGTDVSVYLGSLTEVP